MPPPLPVTVPTALEIATACARIADDIQAEDIIVLDLRGISSLADYFVICTGTSMPHLRAIRREISEKTATELGEKPRSVDGSTESRWLVIDYVNVVVHIFHKDKREHYALEDLWGDAPRVDVGLEAPATGSRPSA